VPDSLHIGAYPRISAPDIRDLANYESPASPSESAGSRDSLTLAPGNRPVGVLNLGAGELVDDEASVRRLLGL
jgi:hypothetical protein